ncbi:MAG TPA: hypothetical protein VJV77_04400 [Casimicrobiaceae bacterium]|nr:hypothetical protein [Casimicrobiaceae bacterium]
MSKRNGVSTIRLRATAERRPRRVVRVADERVRVVAADSNARRDFIKRASVAAAALGLPGLPAGTAAAPGAPGVGVAKGQRKTKATLFFNLSHLVGVETTHFLYMGGRKHELAKVADKPQVLRQARKTNALLRAIADDQITHHVKNVEIATDAVTLAYMTCNENPSAGTWEMTSMHFNIPPRAVAYAYAQARAMTPSGPLPRSGKRRFYNLPPAMTQSDLEDELALVDITNHAEALVGLHPDILSVEPDSAAHIQTNYVSQDSNTQFLAALLQQTMGPAVPEGMTNLVARPPWATLKPLVNDATGQPYKKGDGQLNQYYPDWSPTVDANVGPAYTTVHPLVKNDPTLGVDVTGFNLNDPNDPVPPELLTGTKWAVHDGIPTVLRSQDGNEGDALVTFTNRGAETGLYVSQPDITQLGDGRVQVTIDNVSNWFLRYLGVWVQFLGPNPNDPPLQLHTLPNDTFPAESGPYPRSGSLDKDDAIFLGVLSPAVAICGVPVYPGQFSPTINIPKSAQTMRILYAGLGQSGSIPADPAGIIGVGVGMTAAFNYGVVGLFMAAGASTYSPVFKLVVSLGGGAVATAVMGLIGGLINQSNFATGLLNFSMGILKVFYQTGLARVITEIVEAIYVELLAAEVVDSIPVAGQIARAVAAGVGAVQLAETSIEVGISPAVYEFDVVQTHDLSINIKPAGSDTQFPQPPPGYSLYYRVSYLFDNGTAHTRDAVNVPDPTVKSIPIEFTGIPRGGLVNISIGFYMRNSTTPPGQNDWCAGFATTGLIDNTLDQAPDTEITEVKTAIQSQTQYLHTRKTSLDGAGNHFWLTTSVAPPYVPPPNGQQPGLGALNAITVRQGTSNPPQAGYVGYAWKAFSTGVNGCGAQAPGQFDQMANLNTDATDNGVHAQDGYINSSGLCGFQPGVRVAYDLLTHNARNLYLDTTSLMIRPVTLDPPSYAGPGSDRSYGQLNFASTRCLLHPAGHAVSISAATSKLEILQLPATPVADNVATQYHLARTVSGPGLLAGLLMTPAALAIAPDGAILVLEQDNNRIQAFDLGGNVAPFFTKQPDPHVLELPATANATYLDLAVEFTGYLYVLSKDAGNNHRLDIYSPNQSGTAPICTTHGVNAAKLTVDFWRRAYMLNYEVLQIPNQGIPEFTEPSVSLWVPTPPNV